jgi:CRP-like cAMP-binding protein
MTAVSENELLAFLPAREQQELYRYFAHVPLRCGSVLHEVGNPIERVYFPERGAISLVTDLTSGALIESAMVGRDGAIGAFGALHQRSALSKAIVQIEGSALVIAAGKLREICGSHPLLYRLLGLHDQLLFAQAQQVAACNAAHHLEARLCRWLLRAHELCGRKFALTQEALAACLGVRRTSVSLTAHHLHAANIIAYRRGVIEIIDLDRLQKTSCECSAALHAQRARLFEGLADAAGRVVRRAVGSSSHISRGLT